MEKEKTLSPTFAASKKTVSLMCLTPLRMTARATPAAHTTRTHKQQRFIYLSNVYFSQLLDSSICNTSKVHKHMCLYLL